MADVNPIPDDYPRLMPYLHLDGAEAAIAFYSKVLGSTERLRMPAPGGKIGHAELDLGDSVLMLADEFPEMDIRGPNAFGGSAVTMNVYVEDVDQVYETALAEGAEALRPPEDQFYGDRMAQFRDPFGHRWSISARTEILTPEEMEKRAAETMGG